MRNLSAAVQAKITQKLGVEPVNILEVQWATDGPWIKYADKDITDYEFNIKGNILSISQLESVVKLDGQGQTQGLSVVLSDTSGDLKTAFDGTDLHGKKCKLTQWFEGLPLSERFTIYQGEINSPIVWGEGDRSLSFEVVTKLSDVEIGFSPEEGQFPYLPNSIIGKPWPIVFGSVFQLPAVLLNEIPRTQTTIASGTVDPTLAPRIHELSQIINSLTAIWLMYVIGEGVARNNASNAQFEYENADTEEEARFWAGEVVRFTALAEQYRSAAGSALTQRSQAEAELNNLRVTQVGQITNSPDSIELVDASNYPQGTQLELQIGEIQLSGSVSGNTLTVFDSSNDNFDGDFSEPFGFTFAQAGELVHILSASPLVYIISIIPVTVEDVQVYKTIGSSKVLTTILSSYYTIKTETMGPYEVTYLTVEVPISTLDNTLGDEIFITCTSNIGPNTVDILRWIVETYTTFDIDETSFASVKVFIENYPSHFALLERKNVLSVLEEIAFQARCAIWVSNNIIYLKYLSEEDVTASTFTESNIDAGSLSVFTTTSEEIVTKLVAEWVEGYAQGGPHTLILRNNGTPYGIRERTIDFYIYNIAELVAKSATFWSIRLSNVWKHLSFSTFIDKLAIETFDLVTFNFAENFVATGSVTGQILQADYNLRDQLISIEAIVPVRCGEMEAYPFYWPKDISTDFLFPTDEEILNGVSGGGGIGEDVEGGIELSELYKTNQGSYSFQKSRNSLGETGYTRTWNYHEEKPTDIDDTKPEPKHATTDIKDSVEPEYNYSYGNYYVDPVEPLVPEIPPEISLSVPAQITSRVSRYVYLADVYLRGLSQEPETGAEVKQQQLSFESEIPIGTWALVAYNRRNFIEIDIEGNETVTQVTEYDMQVPIWL
jgi:hypothetical protein